MLSLFGTSAPYGLGSSLRLWCDARSLLGRAAGASFAIREDISDDAWTKVNATTGSPTQLIDTNDATSKTHMAFQAAIGATTDTTVIFTVTLEAGTKTWARVFAGSISGAYVNLETGALGVVTNGSATVTDAGFGRWRVELVATPLAGNALLGVALANGDLAQSYQGDGAGTIYVYEVDVQQQLVTTWPDWAEPGYSDLDEVSTNKPVWSPYALDGARPGVIFSRASSNYLGRGAGGVSAILDGDDMPATALVVARRGPDITAGAGGLFSWDNSATALANWVANYVSEVSPTQWTASRRDATGAGVTANHATGFASQAPEVYQFRYTGAAVSTWRTDTALLSGTGLNQGPQTHDLFTLGCMRRGNAPNFFGNWTISEIRIWAEAIPEAARLRELTMLKLKWGIA